MKKLFAICAIFGGLYSCNHSGQHSKSTDKSTDPENYDPEAVAIQPNRYQELLGCWVGDFSADEDNKNNNLDDNDDYWTLHKKICLSIDSIIGSQVFGHSLVGGLQRSFKGTFEEIDKKTYSFRVKEPGTNPYDGTFDFKISNNTLMGDWTANGKLRIMVRKYTLNKRKFEYNPHNMFEEYAQYVDENDTKKQTYTEEIDGEINEYTQELYVASTDKIMEINASLDKLTKEEVENLKKVDIMIIRNSIYARHGFSFRDPNLRSFFESQEWYMPVTMDIQKDLTKLEKDNIKLLLRYEKIAEQNYDSFGR